MKNFITDADTTFNAEEKENTEQKGIKKVVADATKPYDECNIDVLSY